MKPEKLISIDQALRALTSSDPYGLDDATVFTVTKGRVGILLRTDDIYEGLIKAPVRLFTTQRKFCYYGIETCGWGAPLVNGECESAPSDHPDRRSCRVITVTDRNGIMESMLTFLDAPDEPVFDSGSTSGTLVKALQISLAYAIIAANV
jgi:hypothetical protein